MTSTEFHEFLKAVDAVCIECLNTDGDKCDECEVRKTAERLRNLVDDTNEE